jgi:hypothetical protein
MGVRTGENLTIKDKVNDSLEFGFGLYSETIVSAVREDGKSVLVELTPKDVVNLRDWCTLRIDALKERGYLPESVTGTL